MSCYGDRDIGTITGRGWNVRRFYTESVDLQPPMPTTHRATAGNLQCIKFSRSTESWIHRLHHYLHERKQCENINSTLWGVGANGREAQKTVAAAVMSRFQKSSRAFKIIYQGWTTVAREETSRGGHAGSKFIETGTIDNAARL